MNQRTATRDQGIRGAISPGAIVYTMAALPVLPGALLLMGAAHLAAWAGARRRGGYDKRSVASNLSLAASQG